MEKTFANATLLSATILATFMIMVPISHLSAQDDVKIDENAKMRKAHIEDIDFTTHKLSVGIDGVSLLVIVDASTTVFLSNGEETTLPSVHTGMNVYLFGEYSSSTRSILADKIIIRNKRITERTTMSRVDMKASRK
jgi:hypothetical protein